MYLTDQVEKIICELVKGEKETEFKINEKNIYGKSKKVW